LDELAGTWVDFRDEERIPAGYQAEAWLAQLAEFAFPEPGQGWSMVKILGALPDADVKHWHLDDLLVGDCGGRAARIDPSNVLLGLHELFQSPWGIRGGIIAARGLSDRYLELLQGLNRDVVHAHAVEAFLAEAGPALVDHCCRMDELISVTLPFQLPRRLSSILEVLSEAYQGSQAAVVVVLARSALESAVHYVYDVRHLERPTEGLAPEIDWLQRMGVMGSEARRLAHDVRLRGNKAVHEDLLMFKEMPQALDTVSRLVRVLLDLREDLEVADDPATTR
jgi:hypothetical protein